MSKNFTQTKNSPQKQNPISLKNSPLSTLHFTLPGTLCVSGQMASGKNYVCKKLIEQNPNLVSIDLDETVHEAISLSTPKILETFDDEAKRAGINLKNDDGTLNRKALGRLIFPRPELLAKQESIVYPKTIELTKKFIEENHAAGKSVIINATVLYKIPELMNLCEKIVFVTAPFFTRLRRARKRDNLPVRQILARFKSQKNLLDEYKKTGIEIVIVNNR